MSDVKVCDICGKTITGFPAFMVTAASGYSVPSRAYKVKIQYSDGRNEKIEWCDECMRDFKNYLVWKRK